MKDKMVVMYRPCGPKEFDLVKDSGFAAWPARLAEQPMFYPVANEQYAREVNAWNVSQYGLGYIMRFMVLATFADRFPLQRVGNDTHAEWWIPAEDVEALNSSIVGKIELVDTVSKL